MQTINDLFEIELRKAVNKRIEEFKENMSYGNFHHDVQRSVGVIEGLRLALEACDEVNKIVGNNLSINWR